jgi:glycosyltransferase involved in cell wall biosynthesis/GR25 family glycosyltransferase involved in LPS biosynthesis
MTPSHITNVFDSIYVLSFPFDCERRIRIKGQLDRLGIKFTFFDSINGSEGESLATYRKVCARPLGQLVKFPEQNQRELKRGKPFVESAGAIGYIFSYVAIVKHAKAKGYRRILTLEDDVILARDFGERLEKFLANVNEDWLVLLLGASQHNWQDVDIEKAEKKGYYPPLLINTCGSFATALDMRVADELIEAAEAYESPFDLLPMGSLYDKHPKRCFVCYPGIVMPDVTDSHIRGSRDQLAHAKEMKWALHHFDFPPKKPIVALLVESRNQLPDRLLRSTDRHSPLTLLAYMNTEDGVRPIHRTEHLMESGVSLQPFAEDVTLPKADMCLRLTPRTNLSEAELLNAIADPKALEQSAKLTRWRFCQAPRVEGRVSVVIPTYKRTDNLYTATESVLEQDYEDIELIIVDDNGMPSPFADEIRAYLDKKRLEKPQANIRYIAHAQNMNGAAARNTGLLASTGECICFLDDDDVFLPGRIGESVNALQQEKHDFDGVYCGFLGWNSPTNDSERYPESNLLLHLLALDYKQHYLHTNTITYRFDALIRTNGFDESYPRHQDLEMNGRFLCESALGAVKKPLVQLRPTLPEQDNRLSGNELFQVKKKFLADFRAVIEQHQPSVIQTIYKAHADEVVRYTNNENMFSLELLRQEIDNFPLHVFTLLNASDALDRSTQQVATDDQTKALEAQLQEIQRKLDYKQLELDDARKSMSYRITAIWRILTKDRFL